MFSDVHNIAETLMLVDFDRAGTLAQGPTGLEADLYLISYFIKRLGTISRGKSDPFIISLAEMVSSAYEAVRHNAHFSPPYTEWIQLLEKRIGEPKHEVEIRASPVHVSVNDDAFIDWEAAGKIGQLIYFSAGIDNHKLLVDEYKSTVGQDKNFCGFQLKRSAMSRLYANARFRAIEGILHEKFGATALALNPPTSVNNEICILLFDDHTPEFVPLTSLGAYGSSWVRRIPALAIEAIALFKKLHSVGLVYGGDVVFNLFIALDRGPRGFELTLANLELGYVYVDVESRCYATDHKCFNHEPVSPGEKLGRCPTRIDDLFRLAMALYQLSKLPIPDQPTSNDTVLAQFYFDMSQKSADGYLDLPDYDYWIRQFEPAPLQ